MPGTSGAFGARERVRLGMLPAVFFSAEVYYHDTVEYYLGHRT